MLLAAKVLCTITYEINIRGRVVNSKLLMIYILNIETYMYVYAI